MEQTNQLQVTEVQVEKPKRRFIPTVLKATYYSFVGTMGAMMAMMMTAMPASATGTTTTTTTIWTKANECLFPDSRDFHHRRNRDRIRGPADDEFLPQRPNR